MKKNIYADISTDESRIGIVEQKQLIDITIKRPDDNKTAGNIYMGIVKNVVEGINSCFVDIGKGKNGFLPIADYKGDIKKNEPVLVQVSKEEIHDKGAKITGKISLAGRYIVFMPTEDKFGVSKNISDQEERKRLKELLVGFAPKGSGFVARTSAKDRNKKELQREAKYLIKIWDKVKRDFNKSKKQNKSILLYETSDIVTAAAREYLDENTEVFYINDKIVFKNVMGFVKKIFPEYKNKVKFYNAPVPIFEKYRIEEQIDKLKKRVIQLDCGGWIIIEQTEALTAIDVNTGSFTQGSNREDTAMKVNMEAALQAASQIIVRDLGGIIIIDFIDMDKKKNKIKLYNTLKEAMSLDKAKVTMYPVTRLGLIEMTRQRRKESIMNIICDDCPYCSGSGKIYSNTTMYIKIKRELLRKSDKIHARTINLFLHPRVAEVFDDKGLAPIEKAIKKRIKLRRDYKIHHEEFRITD